MIPTIHAGSRRSLLTAALGFALVRVPEPIPPALKALESLPKTRRYP